MIRSFGHKGLRRFFVSGTTAGINPNHAPRLRLILAMPDGARYRRPGELANWRVRFRFEDGDVQDIDYVDYH
jgi:proteic killer suppression protein